MAMRPFYSKNSLPLSSAASTFPMRIVNCGCGYRRDIVGFVVSLTISPHWFRPSFLGFCNWLSRK
jgi:hypothetical protein